MYDPSAWSQGTGSVQQPAGQVPTGQFGLQGFNTLGQNQQNMGLGIQQLRAAVGLQTSSWKSENARNLMTSNINSSLMPGSRAPQPSSLHALSPKPAGPPGPVQVQYPPPPPPPQAAAAVRSQMVPQYRGVGGQPAQPPPRFQNPIQRPSGGQVSGAGTITSGGGPGNKSPRHSAGPPRPNPSSAEQAKLREAALQSAQSFFRGEQQGERRCQWKRVHILSCLDLMA